MIKYENAGPAFSYEPGGLFHWVINAHFSE